MILAYRGRQTSRGTFWINLTIALTSLTQWHPSEVAAGVAIGGEGWESMGLSRLGVPYLMLEALKSNMDRINLITMVCIR